MERHAPYMHVASSPVTCCTSRRHRQSQRCTFVTEHIGALAERARGDPADARAKRVRAIGSQPISRVCTACRDAAAG